ncbi:hypothetical protein [Mesobacillus foraminis]|uniref:hypothetical protein n=1 Tax=Mesobacillus foraminis TaxID=279826 RepID=UPI000EF48A41|nr:hypothetical protein [Mesobacillus foraminis]
MKNIKCRISMTYRIIKKDGGEPGTYKSQYNAFSNNELQAKQKEDHGLSEALILFFVENKIIFLA